MRNNLEKYFFVFISPLPPPPKKKKKTNFEQSFFLVPNLFGKVQIFTISSQKYFSAYNVLVNFLIFHQILQHDVTFEMLQYSVI